MNWKSPLLKVIAIQHDMAVYFISHIFVTTPLLSCELKFFVNKCFKLYGIIYILVMVGLGGICMTAVCLGYDKGVEWSVSFTQDILTVISCIVSVLQSIISTMSCILSHKEYQVICKQYHELEMPRTSKNCIIIFRISTGSLLLIIIMTNWMWLITAGLSHQFKYFIFYYLVFVEHLRMMLNYLFIVNVERKYRILNSDLEKSLSSNLYIPI